MASSDINLCSLCKEDDINKEAITWCTECETWLCLDCDKHHSRNKSSKQHTTLRSNDYNKLPAFIIKTSNKCPDHDQRYELYCPNHSEACCFQCFTEKHQDCKDLKRLPDILKDANSSASMTHIHQDLSDTNENYERIATYLSGRLSTMLKQKTSGIEEIHIMRKSLNETLDKLEQTMMEELNTEHTKLEAKTKKIMNIVETKRNHLIQLQEDQENIKNYANEYQTLIGLKEIARTTTTEADYLQELTKSGDLDEANLEVDISSNVKSALQNLTSFGSVSVTSEECSLELIKKAECQVPVSVPKKKTRDNTSKLDIYMIYDYDI